MADRGDLVRGPGRGYECPRVVTTDRLLAQEAAFARAFAARDLGLVRDRYDPDVVYLSPTVRLFGWPRRIEGVERTLEFIALTIQRCETIHYEAVEWAIAPHGKRAFVIVHFDWTLGDRRLRSRYVVVYHYRAGRIVQQEVCYDPSAPPEVLSEGGGSR
jgi:ketosteroid isomerase-like protein